MVMVMMMKMQDEWVCILPIVIHRILTQYQDIQNYKKVSLHLLIYNRPSVPPTIPSLIVHQGELWKSTRSTTIIMIIVITTTIITLPNNCSGGAWEVGTFLGRRPGRRESDLIKVDC